jgi:hypothetical protein
MDASVRPDTVTATLGEAFQTFSPDKEGTLTAAEVLSTLRQHPE